MIENAEIYTMPVEVQPEDIDELGHVNNIVYLQWVQQIAGAHWMSRTSREIQESHIWVVLNHYIEYKHPAFLHDRLTLKTYIGETTGPRSIRYVEILRGEELLAKAKTEWCLLDARTMRPRRATPELMDLFIK